MGTNRITGRLGIVAIAFALILSASTFMTPSWAAADISGQWQGILHAGKDQRILLRIAKSGAAFRGTAYSIDEGPDPVPIGALTVTGVTVSFTIGCCSYTATLDAQGRRMKGALYGGASYPLDLVRADPKTGWAIPKPKPDTSPHKARFVTVEKNVKLEVLDWAATDARWSSWRGWAARRMTSTSSRHGSSANITSMPSPGAAWAPRQSPSRLSPIMPARNSATMSGARSGHCHSEKDPSCCAI
jgi:hypothetical protein